MSRHMQNPLGRTKIHKTATDALIAACRFQGEVFQKSAEVCGCSSAIFVRRFMNSHVAALLDQQLLWGVSLAPEDVFAQLESEYGPSSYGQTHFDGEALYWMGYLLRYWAITRNIASKALYKLMKPGELAGLFAVYHTLDPDQAIDRIAEAKGLPEKETEEDLIERGVRELRRIRSENHYEYAVVRHSDLVEF